MKRLFTALTIFTYFTMVLGGWVRNADAGLSCPDWPLCHGKLIPPLDYQIMLEYFHRLAVSLVSLTLIVITVLVLRDKESRKNFGKALGLLWFLLVVQIVLGGLTVTKLLKGEIVAMHLSTALAFFTALLWATLKAYRLDNPHRVVVVSPLLKNLARISLVAIACQVVLGGVVSSHYARWGCPDFPKCQGTWVPAMEGLAGIHYTHRLWAYVASMLVTLFCVLFIREEETANTLPAWLILALLLGQWLLGICLIFTAIKVYSVAHLATAILIFALLLILHDEIQSRRLS